MDIVAKISKIGLTKLDLHINTADALHMTNQQAADIINYFNSLEHFTHKYEAASIHHVNANVELEIIQQPNNIGVVVTNIANSAVINTRVIPLAEILTSSVGTTITEILESRVVKLARQIVLDKKAKKLRKKEKKRVVKEQLKINKVINKLIGVKLA